MNECLKKIDIFGMTFSFTTLGHEKFKSSVGAFITIICLGIIGVFSFIFGRNFYYRENPSVLNQKVVPQNYTDLFELNKKNLFVAFRITQQGFNADIDGMLWPTIEYVNFDNANNNMKALSMPKIVPCSDPKVFDEDFAYSFKADLWWCPDWSSVPRKPNETLLFGGGWDAPEVAYFAFSINTCENRVFLNGTKCADKDALKRSLATGLYIDVAQPENNFSPDNYDKPLKRTFKSNFYKMDYTIRKTDRIYIEETTLNDDRGWIFEDVVPTKMYSVGDRGNDFSFFDDNAWGVHGRSANLYNMAVYMTKPYTKLKRTYMKIQDVGAILGGFLKFILLFANIISNFFSKHLRNENLYNVLFDKDKDTDRTIDASQLYKSGANEGNMTNNYVKGSDKGLVLKPLSDERKVNPPLSDERKVNPEPNTTKVPLNLNHNDVSKNLNNSAINKKLLRRTSTEIKKRQATKSIKLGFRNSLCPSKKNVEVDFVKKYLKERLDISNYLKQNESIERFKQLILNKEQSLMFRYFRKPNMCYPEDIKSIKVSTEEMEKDIEKIVEYFRSKVENKSLTDYDKTLFSFIDPSIAKILTSSS